MKIRRALLSVSDKTGLASFARELDALGVELISTGGTFRHLREQGVAVKEVSEVTGFPEIMDGRVKTLHPRIHGGILGRRGADDAVMREHGIPPIDLVVVNLYPFEDTARRPGAARAEIVENIDVGGPAMVRAAAKNHAHVAVVVDPADYPSVLADVRGSGLSAARREALAAKAFAHTARYDGLIAAYLSGTQTVPFPPALELRFAKHADLRYGENPHQRGALYLESPPPAGTVAGARQRHGKELSFNNLADADTALECVKQFTDPACVIVKHANPCGVAEAAGIAAAYDLAYAADATSAFGGIIAFNRPLDEATLKLVLERQFVEVIVAPALDDRALAAASAKPNVRLLETGAWPDRPAAARDLRRLAGGLLAQDADAANVDRASLKAVTKRQPSDAEFRDLLFAWRVAKFVKSNAIVYAKDRRTLGIGPGQTSRIYSAKIARLKAGEAGLDLKGSAMASDAFLPFRDTVDAAAEAGATALIHPGGSVRDREVIAAADEHGLAMVFTGVRHFRH